MVFTGRGPERILSEGGSQAWALDPRRARACEYLVCCQNRGGDDWGNATEPHRSAFLIGKIRDVVPAWDGAEGRYLIAISHYAPLAIPNMWDKGRNPVRYVGLEEIGVDPAALQFEPLPDPSPEPAGAAQGGRRGLTLAEAKRGLAEHFGVSPDAVEITIRG